MLVACSFCSVAGQKKSMAQRRSSNAELADGNVPVALSGDELISKVESQLFNAVGLLQAYQEAAPMPLKFAEKRRNKFEFIRFGRRRR